MQNQIVHCQGAIWRVASRIHESALHLGVRNVQKNEARALHLSDIDSSGNGSIEITSGNGNEPVQLPFHEEPIRSEGPTHGPRWK